MPPKQTKEATKGVKSKAKAVAKEDQKTKKAVQSAATKAATKGKSFVSPILVKETRQNGHTTPLCVTVI